MLKKIVAGYTSLLVKLLRILLLMALCIGVAFLIVLPLWKFATSNSSAYTIFVTIIAIGLVVFYIFRRIQRYLYGGGITNEEKSGRKKTLIFAIAKVAVVAIGLSSACLLVLSYKRFPALIVLVAMIVIYGIIAFGLKKTSSDKNKKCQ